MYGIENDGDINALDVLLAQNRISLRTYLAAYPKDALSNKEEILKGVEAEEQGRMAQLTRENQELTAQLTELAENTRKYAQTVAQVESLITENEQLRIFIARLYTEAKQKIVQSNAQIAETTADASQFARDIADTIGLSER